MTEDWRYAGAVTLDNGHRIPLRLPCVPRAPRYECPKCGAEVTGNMEVSAPGLYGVTCEACASLTRVVVTPKFLMVLS